MGNFGGHALPGGFFMFFGFWHLIQQLRKYYKCRMTDTVFTFSTWYPVDCCCGKMKEYPIEVVIRIILIAFALALEIITGSRNGVFDAPANQQHATMYFFFILAGIFELLVYFKVNLPPHLDKLGYFLAFSVELILFKLHLHGRTDMDILVHTLLLYVIFATVLCVLAGMKYPHHELSSFVLSYLFLVQGSWFFQIGFILYNPIPGAIPWEQNNHRQMMVITSYFAWHLGVNLILVLLLAAFIGCFYRSKYNYKDVDARTMKRLIHTNSNGQSIINMENDTDEDEF